MSAQTVVQIYAPERFITQTVDQDCEDISVCRSAVWQLGNHSTVSSLLRNRGLWMRVSLLALIYFRLFAQNHTAQYQYLNGVRKNSTHHEHVCVRSASFGIPAVAPAFDGGQISAGQCTSSMSRGYEKYALKQLRPIKMPLLPGAKRYVTFLMKAPHLMT